MQKSRNYILLIELVLGGKGEGVDTAKLAVGPVLDELFDRTHRFRLRRLSQTIEECVGFDGTFHGTLESITVTLWLGKQKASDRCAKHSPLGDGVPFPQYLLCPKDWFEPKPDCCGNGKHYKKRQNNELCKFKWRLGLRRSKHMQTRDFFERLHD